MGFEVQDGRGIAVIPAPMSGSVPDMTASFKAKVEVRPEDQVRSIKAHRPTLCCSFCQLHLQLCPLFAMHVQVALLIYKEEAYNIPSR